MKNTVERRTPHMILTKSQIEACIGKLYGDSSVQSFSLATDGLANTNYIVTLKNGKKIVLRIHLNANSEKGLKEFNLSQLLISFSVVPKVLFFEPVRNNIFSYSIIEFIDGEILPKTNIRNQKLLRKAYFEIGATLSQLKKIKFSATGLLDENLRVIEIKTRNTKFHPFANYIMDCLDNERLAKRTGTSLQNAIRELVNENELLLYATDEDVHLVHGDFKTENIMVSSICENKIHLAGILDWEHARSGTSYGDIASLFRGDYDKNSEAKKAFSEGYTLSGDKLIQEWDKASKLVDLINLCSFLCSERNRKGIFDLAIAHIRSTIAYFDRE